MNFLPFDVEGVINKSEGDAPFATESISMIGENEIKLTQTVPANHLASFLDTD